MPHAARWVICSIALLVSAARGSAPRSPRAPRLAPAQLSAAVAALTASREDTALIIDGNNVRGLTGFRWSKAQLSYMVDRFTRALGLDGRVAIVWDHGAQPEAHLVDGAVVHMFAGPNSTADDVIAACAATVLHDASSPSSVWVATSDRELVQRSQLPWLSQPPPSGGASTKPRGERVRQRRSQVRVLGSLRLAAMLIGIAQEETADGGAELLAERTADDQLLAEGLFAPSSADAGASAPAAMNGGAADARPTAAVATDRDDLDISAGLWGVEDAAAQLSAPQTDLADPEARIARLELESRIERLEAVEGPRAEPSEPSEPSEQRSECVDSGRASDAGCRLLGVCAELGASEEAVRQHAASNDAGKRRGPRRRRRRGSGSAAGSGARQPRFRERTWHRVLLAERLRRLLHAHPERAEGAARAGPISAAAEIVAEGGPGDTWLVSRAREFNAARGARRADAPAAAAPPAPPPPAPQSQPQPAAPESDGDDPCSAAAARATVLMRDRRLDREQRSALLQFGRVVLLAHSAAAADGGSGAAEAPPAVLERDVVGARPAPIDAREQAAAVEAGVWQKPTRRQRRKLRSTRARHAGARDAAAAVELPAVHAQLGAIDCWLDGAAEGTGAGADSGAA